MIQIWKPKYSATVIRLDSVFAHGDGLPCRRIGTTANRLGDASSGRARIGRVLSVKGLLATINVRVALIGDLDCKVPTLKASVMIRDSGVRPRQDQFPSILRMPAINDQLIPAP